MGNYQGYQKYQDSGVKWLGDIPEHWEVKRFKFILQDGYEGLKIGPFGNQIKSEKLSSSGNYKVYGQENIINQDFALGYRYLEDDLFQELSIYEIKVNDLLITMMGTSGRCYIVPENFQKGIMDSHLIRLRLSNNHSLEFIRYLIDESEYVSYQVKTLGKGSIMHGLNSTIIKSIELIIPPLIEQEKIAQFLDYKTKQIDELIKKKETLIEKLDEKRTAIISHAVTKGLDSSVPIKDSGVEWLGDIPKHWEVKRLRYIGSCQNGISKGADYFGFGYPFVNYTDVYANIELPKTVSGLANSTDMDRINYSVQKGDIFFTRTSETIEEIGITSTCFNSINNATFSGFLIRVRPFPNLLFTGFSKYYFRCQLHRLFFVKEMNLVTRASLSQELLKRLPVLLPTIEEQKQISKHLDQKTAQIDQQKAKIKQAIELLKEYRTSLITNAVTGKIDVSQIAVP
jgi:type I restriction enzyme S subunit